MSSTAKRLAGVLLVVALVTGAIVYYISGLLRSPTPTAAAQVSPHRAQLTLGTTPAVGKLGGNPELGLLSRPPERDTGITRPSSTSRLTPWST